MYDCQPVGAWLSLVERSVRDVTATTRYRPNHQRFSPAIRTVHLHIQIIFGLIGSFA